MDKRPVMKLFILLTLFLILPGISFLSCSEDDDEDEIALYGPENSWWHANADDVPDGLTGTGWETDDVAYNFSLYDQFGDLVELYQFYGRVIVLDVFTTT